MFDGFVLLAKIVAFFAMPVGVAVYGLAVVCDNRVGPALRRTTTAISAAHARQVERAKRFDALGHPRWLR